MPDLENNKIPNEVSDSKEYNKDAKEEASAREFYAAKEVDSDGSEYAASNARVKKIRQNAQSGGKFATGAAVVGVASLIVIGTSGLVNIDMDGSIESLLFQDNQIVYNVNVSDVEKGNTMYFEISEGKSKKVISTKEILSDVKESLTGEIKGQFDISDLNIEEKLKENESLTYTFHLCGNTGIVNRTYDSYILEINEYTSEFRSISYQSDYANSGNFLFWLDFTDSYGIFTDFSAYLIAADNTKRDCTFTENLHDTQSIFILDLVGGEATFTVSFMNNGKEEVYTYEVLIQEGLKWKRKS